MKDKTNRLIKTFWALCFSTLAPVVLCVLHIQCTSFTAFATCELSLQENGVNLDIISGDATADIALVSYTCDQPYTITISSANLSHLANGPNISGPYSITYQPNAVGNATGANDLVNQSLSSSKQIIDNNATGTTNYIPSTVQAPFSINLLGSVGAAAGQYSDVVTFTLAGTGP